jgi:hypothetical protein
MDSDVFATRVAPLLLVDQLLQLRAVNRAWLATIDSLLPYKSVFVACKNRGKDSAAMRYLLAHGRVQSPVEENDAVISCLNSLEETQWVCSKRNLDKEEWLGFAGSLDVFNYLSEGLTRDQILVMLPMLVCQGQLAMLESVMDSLNVTRHDQACSHHELLVTLFQRDSVPGVAWWVDRLGLTRDEIVLQSENFVFRWSCINGYLEFAQWLTDRFQIDRDDVRASDNFVLRKACSNGHLHIAQWLTESFQLGGDDIRSEFNFAFNYSCYQGHIAVAQWIVDRFQLTKEEGRKALSYAYTRPDVKEWLGARFQLF